VKALAQVEGLVVSYATDGERDGARGGPAVRALDGASLHIAAGERVGLVGESGSGKSTLGMALGRLLAANARCEQGHIEVDGQDVLGAPPAALRQLRRERLGFVFQNPMAALDPTLRIGRQMALALGQDGAPAAVAGWLSRVGLPDPARVAASFPHELSGGMAQRVVIAMALSRRPALLIADEPTASLDASIQGLILDLLDGLLRDSGAALLLMSHDLRLVARRCDRVLVMYGGRVVESGPSRAVFEAPRHPYTRALIRAAAGNEKPGQRLEPIPGMPPVLRGPAGDCSYAPRCAQAQPRCRVQRPLERRLGRAFETALDQAPERDVASRRVACHYAEFDSAAAVVAAAGQASP
jgi:oligopeptide/dipeptide ABC transporter ATP-binding protein